MNSFWRSGRTKRSEKRTQITSADEVAAKMTAAGCSGGIFWLPADWLNVQEAAKHTKQEQGGAVNLIGLNVSQLWVTFTPEFSPPIDSGASKRGKRGQLMMELNGQTRGALTEVDAGRWRRCCLIEFSRRFFLHPPAPSTKILSQDVAKCIPADPVADRWPNPTKIPIRMQKSFSNFQIFCRSMALHWNSIECPMKRTHCQLLWPLRVTETDRTGQMIKTTNATSAEVTFDVSSTGKSICRAPSLENSRAPFNCCIMSYLVSNESSLP